MLNFKKKEKGSASNNNEDKNNKEEKMTTSFKTSRGFEGFVLEYCNAAEFRVKNQESGELYLAPRLDATLARFSLKGHGHIFPFNQSVLDSDAVHVGHFIGFVASGGRTRFTTLCHSDANAVFDGYSNLSVKMKDIRPVALYADIYASSDDDLTTEFLLHEITFLMSWTINQSGRNVTRECVIPFHKI
jgi:hypothetical protein